MYWAQVYRQELMRQYHKELQEWNEEKARQEVEFTITDRKVKVRSAKWASHSQILPEERAVMVSDHPM